MQKTLLILSKSKTTADKPWLQVFSGITKSTHEGSASGSPALTRRRYVRYSSVNFAASAGNNSPSAINAQEMPLLQGMPRLSRGGGHRRTGIVANRGGSSFSEKEAEIEGVRDRCILQCTNN
ncbi:MAG: hypothetical protein ACO22T_11965, partial [Burkholderiales bacterium]